MRIIVCSIYFPKDANTADLMRCLQTTIDQFWDASIIIAGDLNGHSPTWGEERIDKRGDLLEDLCAVNDLLILNNPLSPPTFTSHRGDTWIDVAACSSRLYSKIREWRVLGEDSLTEHSFIEFKLLVDNTDSLHTNVRRSSFWCSHANWKDMQDFLFSHLVEWYSDDPDYARLQISTTIDTITEACNRFIPKKTCKRKGAPWWTPELTNLRDENIRL
ncbi:uncharacterized protein [Centruroides vittatus]|uniref:uncharacterized protein n=1 Tax=Centruroides vittatus TaxID=120091 RepID=UPI00350F8834